MEIKVEDFTIPLIVNRKVTAIKSVIGEGITWDWELRAGAGSRLTPMKSNSVQTDPEEKQVSPG